MGNPFRAMLFGVATIGFAVYSIATRTETPPPGYVLLDYGLIALGAAGIVGSLVMSVRKK